MASKVDVRKILELVGGKENVASVTHCATRLRIRLKDENRETIEEIKKISGVLGIQKNVGELQVIIGPAVGDVYQKFIEIGGFAVSEKIDENLDEKKTAGFKMIVNTFFEAMTGCISPIVYAFIVMGMFKSVSAIFGPSLLGWISAESDLYILLEGVSSAITYTGIVAAGEPFKVFGLFPMTLIDYSSSFLPIILIVAVQAYIEKLLKKIIPDVVKTVLVPTLTVVIMTVLGLCILGPLGQWLGNGLANVVMLLSEHAGWLEGALVGALYIFMVAFGLGGPVFLATFAVYTQTGADYLYFPYMVLYGMALVGVNLGYIIKNRNADERQTGIVALTSQLLGGVSESTIYGVLFRNKVEDWKREDLSDEKIS